MKCRKIPAQTNVSSFKITNAPFTRLDRLSAGSILLSCQLMKEDITGLGLQMSVPEFSAHVKKEQTRWEPIFSERYWSLHAPSLRILRGK